MLDIERHQSSASVEAINSLSLPCLRIGAFELAVKDEAYLRALVRLFAYTEKLHWAFVETAPFHALVVKQEDAGGEPCRVAGFTGLLLKLGRTAKVGEDTIDYPIQAPQLKDWLKRNNGGAPSPLAMTSGRTSECLNRYRLRRWPPAAQLRGDVLYVRAATLLSRKAYCAVELAEQIGRSPEFCADFISILLKANLLVGEVDGVSKAPVRPAAKTGLFSSLRRRIGLLVGA